MSITINDELLKSISNAAAGVIAPDPDPEPDVKPRKKKSGLPVYFYNSRYPNEVFIKPDETWFNKAINANEPSPDAKTIKFFRGQFIAKEQWQADLLRSIPHVHEADIDHEMQCEECNYRTRSTSDYQQHMKKHL